MLGKYAIRILFSFDSSLEVIDTANTYNRIIPTILAEISDRVFIKQRYICRLKNHRILAQASQKFFEK
jgi:hypothetical protein